MIQTAEETVPPDACQHFLDGRELACLTTVSEGVGEAVDWLIDQELGESEESEESEEEESEEDEDDGEEEDEDDWEVRCLEKAEEWHEERGLPF